MSEAMLERCLLILDGSADALDPSRVLAPNSNIDVFPVTDRSEVIDRAVARLRGGTKRAVRVLEVAQLLEEDRGAFLADLTSWSQKLGEREVDGRSVKQALLLPDGRVSAFWFGAVGERNQKKVSEYLLVAQVRVLEKILAEGGYGSCIISVQGRLERRVFADLARAHVEKVESIRNVRWRFPGTSWRLSYGRRAAAFRSLLLWLRSFGWGMLAAGLKLPKSYAPGPRSPLLFLTYFPFLEQEAAAKGEFKNQYALELQQLLRDEGRPVAWVGQFVYLAGSTFRDAVRLARRFVQSGERLTLVEAYFSPWTALRTLGTWLRIRGRARRLERRIGSALGERLLPPAAIALARQLWIRSYEGPDLLQGLCFYAAFSRLMRDTSGITTCLYYWEMFAWEHAFNAAAHARSPPMETIAFQHATFSTSDVFCVRPAGEVRGEGTATDLPVPDRLCVSGEQAAEILSGSGYRGLTVVESIRYLAIEKHLSAAPVPRSGPPVILVAGAGYSHETKALLSLISRAYPRADGVKIWIRVHMALPLSRFAEDLGLDLAAARYEIASGPLYEVLSQTSIVIATATTVALEALAFGCDVLVPSLPSFSGYGPLDKFDRFYTRVYDADDIRRSVELYAREGPRVSLAEKQAFVRHYWTLDATLPRWRTVLGLSPAPPSPRV